MADEQPFQVSFGRVFPVFATVNADGTLATFHKEGREMIALDENKERAELFITQCGATGITGLKLHAAATPANLHKRLVSFKEYLDDNKIAHPWILWNCARADAQTFPLVSLESAIVALQRGYNLSN